MLGVGTRPSPRPGEVWLSCPPYLLIAHILEVDEQTTPGVVSYELHDEEGYPLERFDRAALDEGWWRAFQPLSPRYG